MTITKDSTRLYKFLKDESRRDDMQELENSILHGIRYCYISTSSGIYLDFNIVQNYLHSNTPLFGNNCRKFDDL